MRMWNGKKEFFVTSQLILHQKLTPLGSFLETKVTGKRNNRGGGYGLEVPCKYRISGQEKIG